MSANCSSNTDGIHPFTAHVHLWTLTQEKLMDSKSHFHSPTTGRCKTKERLNLEWSDFLWLCPLKISTCGSKQCSDRKVLLQGFNVLLLKWSVSASIIHKTFKMHTSGWESYQKLCHSVMSSPIPIPFLWCVTHWWLWRGFKLDSSSINIGKLFHQMGSNSMGTHRWHWREIKWYS